LRDENVNKNIIEITKFLGRNLYEKKNLNTKIDKYLNEIEKKNLIKEENSIQEEDSLTKEQILLQETMLRNLALDAEGDKEYERLGVNEKQEILNLVREGRKEKTKQETLQEDLSMFETFKHDVIQKETMYKSLCKTQFKNQILHYSDYSGTQVNFASAANTGIVNMNREFYENYQIDTCKFDGEAQSAKKNCNYTQGILIILIIKGMMVIIVGIVIITVVIGIRKKWGTGSLAIIKILKIIRC